MQFRPSDIGYLLIGNDRQKQAYNAIHAIGLFEKLSLYSPLLAGTIPLDIDTDSSDLDIICDSPNLKEFTALVRQSFGGFPDFECCESFVRLEPSFIARFHAYHFDFELFCQKVPVLKQFAVLHLHAEARLLVLGGSQSRNAIRELKKSGIKTEPAFAQYFNIQGDPYLELAKIAALSDEELKKIVYGRN